MRKIFLLTAFMFGVVVSVNAQIKIEQTLTNDLIIIGNISGGSAMNIVNPILTGSTDRTAEHRLYCRVFKDKVIYGILVYTQNKFYNDFEFALGTDIEKAKESIKMMLSFMANAPLKRSQTITDEDNRVIQLNLVKRKHMTLRVIDAHGEIICNKAILSKGNLERAIKLLDKKAERKVATACAKNNGGL